MRTMARAARPHALSPRRAATQATAAMREYSLTRSPTASSQAPSALKRRVKRAISPSTQSTTRAASSSTAASAQVQRLSMAARPDATRPSTRLHTVTTFGVQPCVRPTPVVRRESGRTA